MQHKFSEVCKDLAWIHIERKPKKARSWLANVENNTELFAFENTVYDYKDNYCKLTHGRYYSIIPKDLDWSAVCWSSRWSELTDSWAE